MADLLKVIFEAVQNGDDKTVVPTVEGALEVGLSASEILDKGLVPGLQALGERFKSGEVFLPEVLISVRAMKRGIEVLKPYLAEEEVQKQGTVVIGTVEGDLHDIGKNLVKLMLEGNGFRVIDLGVDVEATIFADAALKHNTDIVAVSALLTVTMVNIPQVLAVLKSLGLRDKVKVMIGGAPVTQKFADSIGAEGFADDCASAVDEAKRLMLTK